MSLHVRPSRDPDLLLAVTMVTDRPPLPQALRVMATLWASAAGGIGVACVVLGAWPVAIAELATVALLTAAIRWSADRGLPREHLEIRRRTLRHRRERPGCAPVDFEVATLLVDVGVSDAITVRTPHATHAIGTCISAAERRRLAMLIAPLVAPRR